MALAVWDSTPNWLVWAATGADNRHARATQIGGSRASHDRGAVTVGNEAPVWQHRCPAGQSDGARQRYDVIGGLPS
jgi:hypothetical protein